MLRCSLTVLDLESNNVAELDQIEQLGTCSMLRDLTLDGNPIAKRKAYRRIVGSIVPQLEVLDYTDVSTKERRPLDDEALTKLRRKCKESVQSPTNSSLSPASPARTRFGGDEDTFEAMGISPRVRRGSRTKNASVSELQMVAEGIKWGSTTGIARARSATGSPRKRPALPRRPHSSNDHLELSSQLSQYKWHREQSGHAANMLALLEEIGVEEGSEKSSSSNLTMGTNVTFAGNPIMAMRARRMAVGDGAGQPQITSVLDQEQSHSRRGSRSGSRPTSADEPSLEDLKADLRSWNLDAAVAKLRLRAGRPSSRPSTAQSAQASSTAAGSKSTASARSTGGWVSADEDEGPSSGKSEVMLLGEDRHDRASDLSGSRHRLMNSSRGGVGDSGDLFQTRGSTPEAAASPTGSEKVVSPGPQSIFSRRASKGWTDNGHSRADSFATSDTLAKHFSRHDDAEDVESDGADEEGEPASRTFRDLTEEELVSMLKKKPKKVPELQVRRVASMFSVVPSPSIL